MIEKWIYQMIQEKKMKKKNILIITYYYKHKNAMASVRAIKMAKYFAKAGYNVTVLTSNQIDTWTKDYLQPIPDKNIDEIYASQVRKWNWVQKYLARRKRKGQERLQKEHQNSDVKAAVVPQRMTFQMRIRNFLVWLFYFQLARQEDICMYKGLRREYKRRHLEEFDTVIATYPTYGAFMMGMWLRRHHKCKQLIADFRDPLYNPGFRDKKAEANYDKKCLENIMKAADQVVCVSQGIANGIRQECSIKKPMTIITNGYDKEDVEGNDIKVQFKKARLHFVYTGTLYHGKRCVDMLAAVLQELINEKRICINDFSFEYAGPDYEELLSQLRLYELEETANNHGFVSRETSIAMQKQADVLLLLTWNEATYQGVVPGKLFEYMSIGKPIIALVTGDVAQSEVAKLVRETNAGCVCEMPVEEDRSNLKEFVVNLFAGNVCLNGQTSEYDYQNISKKYAEVIERGGQKIW